MSWRNRRRL